jgi:Transposase DDE domain group 1
VPVHDRGRVLTDVAVLIADGGRVLSDMAALRDQGELFGPVASDPTVWRALDEIGEVQRRRIARARARTREHVWSLVAERHGGIPPSRVADRDLGKTVTIRLDASLVVVHSDKELAAGTFKHTFGYHPLMAWCDNTGESLACKLRTGKAGSNTVADHTEVLDAAIAQVPARYRRNLLVTLDGAGFSHGLIDHITALNARPGHRVHYSAGWDLGDRERTAIARVPARAWGQVLDTEGQPRSAEKAGVVELTGLLRSHPDADQLARWPKDLWVICRREKPHPGAQLSLFEETDGWRYQLFATNTPASTVQFLQARHRPHARVEDCIRDGKQTGLGHLPSTNFDINQAWLAAATIACDLLCWIRLLCLTGPLAKAEPKTLRYRLPPKPPPHPTRPTAPPSNSKPPKPPPSPTSSTPAPPTWRWPTRPAHSGTPTPQAPAPPPTAPAPRCQPAAPPTAATTPSRRRRSGSPPTPRPNSPKTPTARSPPKRTSPTPATSAPPPSPP